MEAFRKASTSFLQVAKLSPPGSPRRVSRLRSVQRKRRTRSLKGEQKWTKIKTSFPVHPQFNCFHQHPMKTDLPMNNLTRLLNGYKGFEAWRDFKNRTPNQAFAVGYFHTLWFAALQCWCPIHRKIFSTIVVDGATSTHPILCRATIKPFKIHPGGFKKSRNLAILCHLQMSLALDKKRQWKYIKLEMAGFSRPSVSRCGIKVVVMFGRVEPPLGSTYRQHSKPSIELLARIPPSRSQISQRPEAMANSMPVSGCGCGFLWSICLTHEHWLMIIRNGHVDPIACEKNIKERH